MIKQLSPLLLVLPALSLTLPANADVLGGSVGASLWLQNFDAQGRDGGDTIDFDPRAGYVYRREVGPTPAASAGNGQGGVAVSGDPGLSAIITG